MSDSEKKAGGDKAAEQEKAPIKPDEVKVSVKPRQADLPKQRDPAHEPTKRQNAANKELADKATDGATKEIREAVTKAAPGGRQAQRDAADKAAQKVGEKLPQRIIKEVQVELPSDKPGQQQTITKPATEGPPSDPPPPKKGI